MEAEVRYEIDLGELSEFLARQIRLVESLRLERAVDDADGLDEAEQEAVWLAAGIATFIGPGDLGRAGAIHHRGAGALRCLGRRNW
jgi:hypothetical protein